MRRADRQIITDIPEGFAASILDWIGRILRRICFLKHVTGGKIERRIGDEKEHVGNYWMTLRKIETTGN